MLFAETFVMKYSDILDFPSGAVREQEMLNPLATQLFTSPSLSLYLIEKSNVLVCILDALESAISLG